MYLTPSSRQQKLVREHQLSCDTKTPDLSLTQKQITLERFVSSRNTIHPWQTLDRQYHL